MALRYGDRHPKALFPASIEEYIEPEAPVRAYDAFIEALDFEALGMEITPPKIGCPQQEELNRLRRDFLFSPRRKVGGCNLCMPNQLRITPSFYMRGCLSYP